MRFTPNSWGAEPLHEYNHNHEPGGSPIGGRFANGPPSAGGYDRPVVIKVATIEEAIRLMAEGKVVELHNVSEVATLLDRLAAMVKDAAAKGEKAPNYNLCLVAVPGTNVFCGAALHTEEFPGGLPRIAMPQFKAHPRPGSEADKLPRVNDRGEVDATDQFVAYLKGLGIATYRDDTLASQLKASQSELVGAQVAALVHNPKFDAGQIIKSRDNYVVDGHHRWAVAVAKDATDNRLGDIRLNTIRMDAPISEILRLARPWTAQFGLTALAGH